MSTWVHRAMFKAPWWSLPINPAFLPRRALWQAMEEAATSARGRLLDVGCGSKPYRTIFTQVTEYLGLELDTEKNRATQHADLYYDGKTFPVADESVDTVLCNQVLEHVADPEEFLSEIHRVLRPGGTLILTVPFFWPEHEQPHDNRRYTSFGLRNQLLAAGFVARKQAKLTRGGGVLFALAAAGINASLRNSPLPFRLLMRMIVIAPLSLLGWMLTTIASGDAELFLDYFVICQKNARTE